jgi:hypothetical protein
VIQSRKLNIEDYIHSLEDQRKKLDNELLKNQITGYLEYIVQLIDIGQIMTKRFLIVVPFVPGTGKKGKKFFSRLKDAFRPGRVVSLQRKIFLDYKKELDLRTGHVLGSLESLGLKAQQLDTQGLIELYYTVYNPTTAMNQPLVDLNDLQVDQTM